MRYRAGVNVADPSAQPRTSRPHRHGRLDALRGLAIVWMAVFHFVFDLAHFQLVQQNLRGDPFWTAQRSAIVTLFLLCAGLGQAVAVEQGQRWPRFWRRWAQVAACAVLVSLASYAMFPRSFISFGVLHALAVMLLVARLSAGFGAWLWPLGLAAVLLPRFFADRFFDSRWTGWIGLVTHKPVTEDYVPLLPWLGVVWWGLAGGRWLLRRHPALLTGALPRALAPLALLGRWSLSFYMLHQPVLIGAILLAMWLR